ncbi:aliphatic sulfonate ABC transporter substrate-binding protein [Cupriavidus sp. YAF13]|uniref:aliphatic sulfonate ABC transporter substrate-binding protein n=1 Tax=Cupriavidus sp. YAF13 TaxID=3233075 RepID=UPI003F9204D6
MLARVASSSLISVRVACMAPALAIAVCIGLPAAAHAQESKDALPREIRLDYAYYSPPSLVLKRFGWLEESLKADKVSVRWVLSQGSNRALEFLNSNSIDFGSTAGLAAVLGRANGNPIKGVYLYSRPEWTALLVPKDSPIRTVADLTGKKVAATKGTDPYLFLLRSLHDAGLRKSDVEIVSLQHADGRAALEQGRVDAWAGLDPLMAASELESGSRLLYRNVAYNTYGLLNVNEAFAEKYPRAVERVLAAYEKARAWIAANPAETAKIVSEESKLPLAVIKVQLLRNDFTQPVPSPQLVQALTSAAPILTQESLVKPGTDVGKVVKALIEPRYARTVVR